MPSGSKKRKKAAAAKRKEDEQVATSNHQASHSPTHSPYPPQDKELEERLEMTSSENARESAAEESTSSNFSVSEAKYASFELAEAQQEEPKVTETPTEKQAESSEAAIEPTELPVSDVKDEFVEPKMELCDCSLEGGTFSVTERSTEVVIDKLTEEESIVSCDVQESVPVRSSPCEGEQVPSATTTEVPDAPVPAPLLEKRTWLWNCCGLFDVFKGS